MIEESKISRFEFDQIQREKNHCTYIAGFDEAGRGPLAGPVASAGVILPPDYENPLINDSKKLTDRERRKLYKVIKEVALAYYVCLVPVETIDTINILEADRQGMETCLEEISKKVTPEFIITDYMMLHTDIPLLSIPRGDSTSLAVAAASILAKVTRDDYMLLLDKQYPVYGFGKNKGYGTKAHLKALEDYGFIPGVHRISFEPVKSMYLGITQPDLF